MIYDSAFFGSEVKCLVEVTSPGFDMVRDDFEIDLKRGNTTKHFAKSDLVTETYTEVEDGQEVEKTNFFLCFDTRDFGKGILTAIITAHVPDTDFADGIRDEVDKFDFFNIMW